MAIAMVVLSHAGGTLPSSWAKWLIPLAGFFNLDCGVQIFFVLSGYLITSILIREYDAIGHIDLKAFYCRRICRIFPAFYLFWFFIVGMTALGFMRISGTDLAFACAHLMNYAHPLLLLFGRPVPDSPDFWYIGHFWTLSMEEQFYWLWPLLLGLLLRKRWYALPVIYLVALPFLRLVTYHFFPGVRGQIMIMLHTGSDAIIAGCLLSIASVRFPNLARKLVFSPWAVAAVVAYILLVDPVLGYFMPRGFGLLAGASMLVAAITLLVANVVLHTEHAWYHRLLETRWLVNLGRISYSVYLWQQVFFAYSNPTLLGKFPFNIGATLLAGWLSYQFIEQPFIRIKDRYFPAHTAKAAAVTPSV